MAKTTDLVLLGAGVLAADKAGYISLGSEAVNDDKARSERAPIFNILPGNSGGGSGGVNEEFLSGMLDEIRDIRQNIPDSETPTTILNFPQLTNPYVPGGNVPQIPQIPGVPPIPTIPTIPQIPGGWNPPTIPTGPGPSPGPTPGPAPSPVVPPGKPDVRNPLVFLYRGAEGTAETGERWTGGIMDTLLKTGTTLGETSKAVTGREYTTTGTFAQGRGNDPAGGSRRRIYQGKLRDVVSGGKGNAWVPGFRPEKGDFIPGSGPLLGPKKKKKIVDTLGTAGPINTGGLVQ